MRLTNEQLHVLKEIKNKKFGSIKHVWGYLRKNGFIKFDATNDGIIVKNPVLTEKGKKTLKPSILLFLVNHWKWIITTTLAVITILISVWWNTSSVKSEANIENSSFTQSPVVTGNVGSINYNAPPKSSYLNERTEDTNIQNAEELINYYFKAYNANNFQKACSLFKKIKCDASNPESIQDFSRFSDKLANGYENVQVKELKELDKKDSIVCVKYSYGLKTDPTPSTISEIFSFYVTNREDGLKEITSRVCEKKYDSVLGDRNCPIEAKKKYCLNVF